MEINLTFDLLFSREISKLILELSDLENLEKISTNLNFFKAKKIKSKLEFKFEENFDDLLKKVEFFLYRENCTNIKHIANPLKKSIIIIDQSGLSITIKSF